MTAKLDSFLTTIDFSSFFNQHSTSTYKKILFNILEKYKNSGDDLAAANKKGLLHLAAYYEDYDSYKKLAEIGLDELYKDKYGFYPFQHSKGKIREEYETKLGIDGLKKIYSCYKPNSASVRCFYDFIDDIKKTAHQDYYFDLLEYLLENNIIAQKVFEEDNRYIPYKGEYCFQHESEKTESITLNIFDEIEKYLPAELKKIFTERFKHKEQKQEIIMTL